MIKLPLDPGNVKMDGGLDSILTAAQATLQLDAPGTNGGPIDLILGLDLCRQLASLHVACILVVPCLLDDHDDTTLHLVTLLGAPKRTGGHRAFNASTNLIALAIASDHRVDTSVHLEPNLDICVQVCGRCDVVVAGIASPNAAELIKHAVRTGVAGFAAVILSSIGGAGQSTDVIDGQEVKVLVEVLPPGIAIVSTLGQRCRDGITWASSANVDGALDSVGVRVAGGPVGGGHGREASIASIAHCEEKAEETFI